MQMLLLIDHYSIGWEITDSCWACFVEHVWMRCGISPSKQFCFSSQNAPRQDSLFIRLLKCNCLSLKPLRSKWFALPWGRPWSNTHPIPVPSSRLPPRRVDTAGLPSERAAPSQRRNNTARAAQFLLLFILLF